MKRFSVALKWSFCLLTLLFAASACHKKRTEKSIEQPASSSIVDIDTTGLSELEKTPGKAHLVASFERTSCFGSCPSFKAEFFSDGSGRYEGRRFAKRTGSFTAHFSRDWLTSVLERAESAAFFSFEKAYPTDGRKIADLPMVIVFMRSHGKSLRVEDNYDAPKSLLELEKFMEEKIEQLAWQKTN